MSDKIKLVQGDQLPRLQITLTDDATGSPIDLTDINTTVSVDFRMAGSDTVTQIPCTKVGDGSAGEVFMDWPTNAMAGDAGAYEGAIVINFNGKKQTVWELMRFALRESF